MAASVREKNAWRRLGVKARTPGPEQCGGQERRLGAGGPERGDGRRQTVENIATQGEVAAKTEARFPCPRSFDPVMLMKTQAVRRDLRKFSSPAQFLILLNSNELSGFCGEPGGRAKKHGKMKG